jgi:phage tail sheath protein FI
MARPGTVISLLDTPNTVSIPTDTGAWFIAGLTDRGPVIPTLVLSLVDFTNKFGARQTYSQLYDCMEVYFREGGNRAYVGRVVGPAATSGFKNLVDNVAAVSLIATAIGPGAWSANYKVAVYTATGGYGIQVQDATGNVLEDSGTLANQLSAVAWSQNSNYIRVTLGASALNPNVMAATALSAGNDDRNNVTDAQWQTVMDSFTTDLGTGQISQCNRTSATSHSQITNHAETHNRTGLLDLVDSPTVATVLGSNPSSHTRFSASFAPWILVPGLTLGTNRPVQPSALVAGLIAKNDPVIGSNGASAGANGISSFADAVTQPAWNDTDRQTLNSAGVNVVRNMLGSVRVYGWRSLADAVNDMSWIDFGNGRFFMALSSELNQVAEEFIFRNITPGLLSEFNDALTGVLFFHYQNGELFGETSPEAFSVDTGSGVNNLQTIAALELHAVCNVKMGVFAEFIQIQIVKRQITDTIS